MSERFIVEIEVAKTWEVTFWTNPNTSSLTRVKPVNRETAEKALARAQRCYPDNKYRIAPAPTEGA